MWAEELPESCPPEDAKEPNNDVYFRLIKDREPTDEDFFSYVKLGNRFPSGLDCQACSISVSNNFDECKKKLEFTGHIKKFKGIVKLVLPRESGVVLATPSRYSAYHHSWWMKKSFSPLSSFENMETKECYES